MINKLTDAWSVPLYNALQLVHVMSQLVRFSKVQMLRPFDAKIGWSSVRIQSSPFNHPWYIGTTDINMNILKHSYKTKYNQNIPYKSTIRRPNQNLLNIWKYCRDSFQ